MKGRILVVDDERSIREILSQVLGYDGYSVGSAASGGEALRLHREQPFDLILLDVKMQGIDGIDTLRQLHEQDPGVRVVMISGHGNIATAVQAVRAGAFDFLEKPLDSDRLLLTVERALDHRQLEHENATLRAGLARLTDAGAAMVGRSAGLQKIRELVARVAPTNARVLITGENGSGKELVARAIHDGSLRHKHPFVEVNSAAIPRELVESELFGHVRGAFTGATGDQAGKFEAADRGTLFLDEIGDLTLEAQAKILRALQEGVIFRVGDTRPIRVDVRVIAATNRDLAAAIEAGRFREDLYFRINVMPIEVPPLRHRLGDVPALTRHFVQVLGAGPGMNARPFTDPAIERLQQHRWPGNVRELRNAVERLLILTAGSEVTADDVDRIVPADPMRATDIEQLVDDGAEQTMAAFREDAERTLILARLEFHRGSVSETARSLGMTRSSLYNRMEKYGIHRDARGGSA